MTEKFIADIHKAIRNVTGHQLPLPDRRFHKHDEYLSYGLKASDFRKIMKGFRPRFLELSLRKRMDLTERLLQEHVGELGHVGVHILTLSEEDLTPQHFAYLDSLPEHFRSWSHVDHLSLGVMQPLLWQYRKETLELLEEWSRSPVRWKRRASVVPFVRNVAKSGEFTEELIHICESLIWDEEDIVLKGIGWALKDNLRSAPDRILPYIKDLRRREVSSTVTLYAIRDLRGPKRLEVLAVRRT
jgi:3-methyladenine DNA glycosylase AlkD